MGKLTLLYNYLFIDNQSMQNWVQSSKNFKTILTDLVSGILQIQSWWVIQQAQRPITELPILARNLIDPSADYDDVWDASAWQMVRVLATRASQLTYKADGLNDTRAGDLWSIGSSIFAVHDHIHPIVKLSPFATAPTIKFNGFTTPTATPIAMTYVSSTEETITYSYQWALTIPNTIGRRNFTTSNVAWFSQKSEVTNLYRNSPMTWYPWANTMEAGQVSNNYWASATTYIYNGSILPWNVVTINVFRVHVTYTLN